MQTDEIIQGRRLTPMLRQYVEAKKAHPNAILMFRMGDFFELFFDDAKTAAQELDLTLTARDKDSADPVPMAGVPHHAVSGYIARLVERGYSVALCDQVEDPRKAKGLVKREITRLITPGTVADLDALDPGLANFLACAQPCADADHFVLALLDLLAGDLLCTRCHKDMLADELGRMNVREVLVPSEFARTVKTLLGDARVATRPLEGTTWDDDAAAEAFLSKRFGTVGHFGSDDTAERRALCHVISFAESTQRRTLRHLVPPRAYCVQDFLVLDETTRRNLELCATSMENRRQGSLLWHLDRCKTGMGSRTLRQWLLFPLREQTAIARRADAVQWFKEDRERRVAVQEALTGVRDIERLAGRVAIGRATPRDMGALRASLLCMPEVQRLFADSEVLLAKHWRKLDIAPGLIQSLDQALVDEPPVVATDGGIFKLGWREDLDTLIELSTEGHGFLTRLEAQERTRTKINSLKVRYNRVFGYYIEITRANLDQVPDDYIRKQTLVGAERFITPELKEFEEKVLYADDRRKEREAELFGELLRDVAGCMAQLRRMGRLVAQTDAMLSLAQVADEGRYVRPTLADTSGVTIVQGRHPVLERLVPQGEMFVPNDVTLDTERRRLMIVTGPNMGGKSTMMRQTALITILAHMGSFVPAQSAQVGLCDRIFTRVGASENLGRGHSTFMVEMLETASILRHATARSLVLLDEIGRGTSTFDGVSIAWAVAEHIHDHIGCLGIFATHYHELTGLAQTHQAVVNMSVAVLEREGAIVFLRQLVEGAANKSYGVQVANLAGVPDVVLTRAKAILQGLEASGSTPAHVPLSAAPAADRNNATHAEPGGSRPPVRARRESRLHASLAALDLSQMTPVQCMAELDRLQQNMGDASLD